MAPENVIESEHTPDAPVRAGLSVYGSLSTLAWHIGALLLAGLILYWPVLKNEFIYNDVPAIANNDFLRDPAFVSSLLTPGGAGNSLATGYYSPISDFSYALDYSLHTDSTTGQLSSRGVHATTLFLYIAVCLLAYVLLLLVTRRPRLAALAALFFLVHPMHAENANFVASRAETLAAGFSLLALILTWWQSRQLGLKILGAALIFFCALFAMLSAPIGLAVPLLLVLIAWRQRGATGEPIAVQWPLRYGPAVGALAVWAALNLLLFGTLFAGQENNLYLPALPAAQRLWLPVQALLRYVTLSFFPYPLTIIYSPLEPGMHALLVNGPVAVLILAILAVVVILAARKVDGVGFGALWFLLAIIPAVIFLPPQQPVAESRLLLPSLGICLILARLLYAIGDASRPLFDSTRNNVAAVVGALLLALFAAFGFTRGRDWKTGSDLWASELSMHPKDEQALASLGFYQARMGNYKAAEAYYTKAKENYRLRPAIFHELAFIQQTNGKDADARKVVAEAMKLDVKEGAFYSKLGLVCERLGDWDQARAAYKKGLKADPQNSELHFNLGNVLLIQKRDKEAIDEYTEALKLTIGRSQVPLLINRSIAYRRAGELDKAIADAEKLQLVDPTEAKGYTLLSGAKLASISKTADPKKKQQLVEEAVTALQEGDTNMPSPNREILLTLSNLDYTLGYAKEGLVNARRAADIDPRDLGAQVFLGSMLIAQNEFKELGQRYADLLQNVPAAGKDPRILSNLGYAFLQLGDTQSAKQLCEQSLKITKANPMGLLLYRRLMEKKVAVNVDLTDMGTNPVFPNGPPEIGAGVDLGSNEPVDLPTRETMNP